MAAKKFTVQYTATAFEQDANQAMKGSVIRGLIELITNADDAYARAKKSGTIELLVRRSSKKGDPTQIIVRDRATGLDPKGMEESFVVLGGDKSGFAAGEEVRGLFSRGSKDTAWFGETVFESIKDGVYTRLSLLANGTGDIDYCQADDSHYETLGLSVGENGLSATMIVSRSGVRLPNLRTLAERISSHVQLRQIVNTQDVTITEFKDGKLIQSPKIVWEMPKTTVLFDGLISIPGYDCDAALTVHRLEERNDGPVNDHSIHGIEIHGRRAAYMNTMFGQSGPAVGFIHGVVSCPMIDDLIRMFGTTTGDDEKNPMRLVSRSRDGLEKEHPFMQALTVAVVEKLKPLLAELESKESEAGSKELQQDLNALARLLADLMKNDLEDDDDDDTGGQEPTPANPIIVIPHVLRARLGSKATLTVFVHEGSVAANGLNVAVSSPACKVIKEPATLVHHPVFAETLVGQVRLEMLALGSSGVTVSAADDAAVSGSAQVVVHDNEKEETEPTKLEWKNQAMSVTQGKTRSVKLRAPAMLAPAGELTVNVSLDSPNIRLEDDVATLRLTKKGWLEGSVHVTGLNHLPESSTIAAVGGGQTAEGTIRTTVPNPLGGLQFEIEQKNEKNGAIRAEIIDDDGQRTMYIYMHHDVLQGRLGTFKDGSWTREKEIDAQVVLAEVMAAAVADFLLTNKINKYPDLYSDIGEILYERVQLLDKYVKALVEGLRVTARK
jgi:hypothetical protein